jgi:hypothetical protein
MPTNASARAGPIRPADYDGAVTDTFAAGRSECASCGAPTPTHALLPRPRQKPTSGPIKAEPHPSVGFCRECGPPKGVQGSTGWVAGWCEACGRWGREDVPCRGCGGQVAALWAVGSETPSVD